MKSGGVAQACECVRVCHSTRVEGRGQLAGVCPLLLCCGSQVVMPGSHSLGGRHPHALGYLACLWMCFFEEYCSYFYTTFYENRDMSKLHHFFILRNLEFGIN